MSCPLCRENRCEPYLTDGRREYLQCALCSLVFVPGEHHLTPEQEKAVYDSHENHVDDPGYRRFLSRVAEPLLARLSATSRGLDFGCGPGPALAAMLEEAGHQMALYDIYYHPDRNALQAQYDFITCTEVIEHLSEPGEVWKIWMALLKPGATLALMTKLVIDKTRFATWHYKNDPTHIAFFSRETFEYLARTWGLTLEVIGNDVIMLSKPA